MKTLEIVHLRSSGEPLESLAERIKESVWEDGSTGDTVTIYRRNGLAADLAVHITHAGESPEVPSRLGLQLVASLAAFGLVNHSIWDEISHEPMIEYHDSKATTDGGSQ